MKRIVSGIMLTLLLINLLTLTSSSIATSKEMAISSLLGDKNPSRATDFPLRNSSDSIASHAEPIIHPEPGQYANYSHNLYYENGTVVWFGWWNMSYIDYLDVDLINATHTLVRPEPSNGTFWLAINKTDRWVPYGNHWWVDSWYSAWIETSITVGSVVNMWKTNGTVTGTAASEMKINGQRISIDCWIVHFSELGVPYMNYTAFFDKQAGVLIELASSFEPYFNLTLVSTNIPVGSWISVYTDRNSYSAGDTMNLGLNVTNPLDRGVTVCIAIWVKKPDGSIYLILHAHAVTLPEGFEYSNPDFKTFTLPSIPTGNYTWHAAFLKRTTHTIIAEDTAEWQFS